jgi:hypothetical protein
MSEDKTAIDTNKAADIEVSDEEARHITGGGFAAVAFNPQPEPPCFRRLLFR